MTMNFYENIGERKGLHIEINTNVQIEIILGLSFALPYTLIVTLP